MTNERFEDVEHTADVAIRVRGRDLAELFANAAYGMAHQITDVGDIELTTERPVDLEADDVEMLMVDWLSELLYVGEQEDVVFVAFDMERVTHHALKAVARGGPIIKHHGHIKAVTFSELDVKDTDEGYETVVVFDV
jgi:SHS2 domain-containing protein